MPGHTLEYLVFLAAGTMALPQNFVLDVGDNAVLDPPPAPLLSTARHAFNWPTMLQTAFAPTYTSVPSYTPIVNSTLTTALTNTRTCLPTTTIIITLPNPARTPPFTSCSDYQGSVIATEGATPFDTEDLEPLSKWPHWFTAATFTLVFYDVLTLGIFLWLWVFGYLWWCRRGRNTRNYRGGMWWRGSADEMEMVRRDILARYRSDGGYEGGAVRPERGYGRPRSESWGRATSGREAELEGEMRRLGMI